MEEENQNNDFEQISESDNNNYEEKPLTREDFFKVLEAVSGTEDDD